MDPVSNSINREFTESTVPRLNSSNSWVRIILPLLQEIISILKKPPWHLKFSALKRSEVPESTFSNLTSRPTVTDVMPNYPSSFEYIYYNPNELILCLSSVILRIRNAAKVKLKARIRFLLTLPYQFSIQGNWKSCSSDHHPLLMFKTRISKPAMTQWHTTSKFISYQSLIQIHLHVAYSYLYLTTYHLIYLFTPSLT